MTILSILGSGRSGSTILGQILDAAEGVFFAGEVIDFWVRGVAENRLCGCHQRAHDCQVWGPVIRRIKSSTPPADLSRMTSLRRDGSALDRLRIAGSPWIPLGAFPPNLFLEMNQLLFELIEETTGCSLIVDSSKFTYYAAALDAIPGLDLQLLHLVRDPRAVAHSWTRRKEIPDPEEVLHVPRFGAIGSTTRWISRNVAASAFTARFKGHSSLLRYEDFVRDPAATLERIQRELIPPGLNVNLSYRPGDSLPVSHALWGNPTRFQSGPVRLKLDDAWRSQQPQVVRRFVELLTAPWLHHYGYW